MAARRYNEAIRRSFRFKARLNISSLLSAAVSDITDGKQVEQVLRQAQVDFARINRVTTMGESTASLAHEISQPISDYDQRQRLPVKARER
jgi:C4-dicarboxylate-specific signal transduction histidine kinase